LTCPVPGTKCSDCQYHIVKAGKMKCGYLLKAKKSKQVELVKETIKEEGIPIIRAVNCPLKNDVILIEGNCGTCPNYKGASAHRLRCTYGGEKHGEANTSS
jgi:hypothetical protein